jgi:hypothetical protein
MKNLGFMLFQPKNSSEDYLYRIEYTRGNRLRSEYTKEINYFDNHIEYLNNFDDSIKRYGDYAIVKLK